MTLEIAHRWNMSRKVQGPDKPFSGASASCPDPPAGWDRLQLRNEDRIRLLRAAATFTDGPLVGLVVASQWTTACTQQTQPKGGFLVSHRMTLDTTSIIAVSRN